MIHPRTALARLIEKAQPLASEVATAAGHFSTIRRRLLTSFKVPRLLPIGSHARHTAVRHYSDIDVLAVLSRPEARWGTGYVAPSTFLARVRKDLAERYPNTMVRGDGQAVVLGFAQYSVDVVPAIFQRFENQAPVYRIPTTADEWLDTSPDAHNLFIRRANVRSGGKLQRVAQLLKWWRHCRSDSYALSGFHVELLLAAERRCEGVRSYPELLFDAFALFAQRGCRGFRDPLGISGVVSAADTNAKLERLCTGIDFAHQHAAAAIQAERRGAHSEACRQWNIVFNGTL